MSRTNRGSKGDGYEYWSRRYKHYGWFNDPGEDTKRFTKRYERRQDKQLVQEEIAKMVMEDRKNMLNRLS